jgi:hypothetical protein
MQAQGLNLARKPFRHFFPSRLNLTPAAVHIGRRRVRRSIPAYKRVGVYFHVIFAAYLFILLWNRAKCTTKNLKRQCASYTTDVLTSRSCLLCPNTKTRDPALARARQT